FRRHVLARAECARLLEVLADQLALPLEQLVEVPVEADLADRLGPLVQVLDLAEGAFLGVGFPGEAQQFRYFVFVIYRLIGGYAGFRFGVTGCGFGVVRLLVVLVPRLLAVARAKRLEGAAGGPERARVGECGGRGSGRAFLVALVPAGRRGAVGRVVGAVGEGGVNVGRGGRLRWRVREGGGFRRGGGRGARGRGLRRGAGRRGSARGAGTGGARTGGGGTRGGRGGETGRAGRPVGFGLARGDRAPAGGARGLRRLRRRSGPLAPLMRPGRRRGAGILLVDDVRVVAAVDYLGVPVGAGIAVRAPGLVLRVRRLARARPGEPARRLVVPLVGKL